VVKTTSNKGEKEKKRCTLSREFRREEKKEEEKGLQIREMGKEMLSKARSEHDERPKRGGKGGKKQTLLNTSKYMSEEKKKKDNSKKKKKRRERKRGFHPLGTLVSKREKTVGVLSKRREREKEKERSIKGGGKGERKTSSALISHYSGTGQKKHRKGNRKEWSGCQSQFC